MDSATNSSLPPWPERNLITSFRWRAEVRVLLVATGLMTAMLWTLAIVGVAWLRYTGYGAIVPWVFVVWFFATLPALYVDLALVLDVVGYIFLGKVHFFPTMLAAHRATTVDEKIAHTHALWPGDRAMRVTDEHRQAFHKYESSWRTRALIRFLGATSPLSCVALWSMIVLARVPSTAHVLMSPGYARDMKTEADERVYRGVRRRMHVA